MHLPDPTHSRQWHTPTSLILRPGESTTYALRLQLTEGGPAGRDAALLAAGRVAIHGVPGFVLSREMSAVRGGEGSGGEGGGEQGGGGEGEGPRHGTATTAADSNGGVAAGGGGGGAKLVIELPASGHASGSASLKSVTSSDASLLSAAGPPITLSPTALSIPLKVGGGGGSGGRARLTLTFSDGSVGTAHYLITPAPDLRSHVQRYGTFLSTTAWLPLNDTSDPFGRGASPLPWDREDNIRVTQDGRPFVVGLSDDAGGGNVLGLAANNIGAPDAAQLARLDEYVQHMLLGKKSHPYLANRTFSLQDPTSLRIRMTVFYYHYTPDFHTALQASYPCQPDYYQELDKCTIGTLCCASPRTAPPPHTAPQATASHAARDAPSPALVSPLTFCTPHKNADPRLLLPDQPACD